MKAERLYGDYYKNENWDPEDDSSNEYLMDETSPGYRTYIITEKARLDEIFSVYPDIDFEKDMVVIYAYTTPHTNHKQILLSITLDNKNLKIEFTTELGTPGLNDASRPQHIHLPIKMDKLDIDTVEFNQLHPSQVGRNSIKQI